MKKITILFLVLLSFKCYSQDSDIVGFWFCETLISVDTIHDEIILNDYSIDTFYNSLPILFEFKDNGTLHINTVDLLNGTWSIQEDSYLIRFDTLVFDAEFQDNKLIVRDDLKKNERLSLIKLQSGTTRKISKEELINSCWEYSYDDSTKYSYHFIDSAIVIMNNGHLTLRGNWYLQYFNGFNILSIDDYNLDFHFLVLTNEYEYGFKGFTYQYSWFNKIYPVKQEIIYSQKETIPDSQLDKLKHLISNHWINSNRFYPNDSLLIDDELLTDLNFEFILHDTTYYYECRGKGTKTGNLYQKTHKGNWEISETGDYIILYFIEEVNGQPRELTELITIKELNESELIIGKYISSLTNDHRAFGTREIRFTKY